MPKLLVSVRSATEAEIAFSGGADLIDVKEPAAGALGRATDATIQAVIECIAARRPISAALGELLEDRLLPRTPGLAYVKWGLAGCATEPNWPQRFLARRAQLTAGCQSVVVAYADWRLADTPCPEEVCAFAVDHRVDVVLFDTWSKTGRSLLDWLSVVQLRRLCMQCRVAGVAVALAGSLRQAEIGRLTELDPDWFAVRGAACRGEDRAAALDLDRVRQLTVLVQGQRSVAIPSS